MELIGFIFIVILGTVLHFVYDWSNHNDAIAIVGAVNESTWEHIKIALTPFFLWLLIEIPFYYQNANFIVAKLLGALTIIVCIPVIFYGYKAVAKKDVLIIDILCFIVSIAFAQLLSNWFLNLPSLPFIFSYISLILLIIIFSLFLLLTVRPIKWFLFQDPINKKYGLKGHGHKKN